MLDRTIFLPPSPKKVGNSYNKSGYEIKSNSLKDVLSCIVSFGHIARREEPAGKVFKKEVNQIFVFIQEKPCKALHNFI